MRIAKSAKTTFRFMIDLLSRMIHYQSLIFTLWFLCRCFLLLVFLYLLLGFDFLNFLVIFVLFILLFDWFLLIFILPEVVEQCVAVTLIELSSDVVELIDIGSGIEKKCEQRMINFIFLVLNFFFKYSCGLILIRIVLALNFKCSVGKIFSLSFKFELNFDMISFMIQILNFKFTCFCYAIYINLLCQ